MSRLTIAVTGMNAHDSPGPGVPVVRGIRDEYGSDCRIIGLAYDALEPGIYMDQLIDHAFLLPYPSEGEQAYKSRIMSIHDIYGIDVLVPTLDAELPIILRMEEELDQQGIKTFLPSSKNIKEISKSRFHLLDQQYGIQVPRSDIASDLTRLDSLTSELGFPVMIKGQFYDAYVAHNYQEAVLYFNKIRDRWGLPIIVQEFILGEEYDVVAVGDGQGGTLGAVPMRKTYLTEKGKAWAGITVSDPRLIELTREVIGKLEWRGPNELEIMRRSKDGELFLMEINPRFPAWTYLAVGAGVNLPATVVHLALGKSPIVSEEYEVGKIFVRYSMDLITDIAKFESITTLGELHHNHKES